MKKSVKRLILSIITNHSVNLVLRNLIWPIAGKLPFIFPITGRIKFDLPDGNRVYFINDGRDTHASRLYWDSKSGFEPESIRLFLKLLRTAETVLDVGANVGIYSLIAAVNDRQRSVHCFEPVPFIFVYLERNIEANKLENLVANQIAASNNDGELALYIPNSIQLPSDASTVADYRGDVNEVRVKAQTLDSYAEQNQLSRIDLIKVDAEGAEYEVFEGARNIIARDKPAIICEILYGFVDKKIGHFFNELNYRYFLITDERLIEHEQIVGDESYLYKNYLFISEERIPKMLEGINVEENKEKIA